MYWLYLIDIRHKLFCVKNILNFWNFRLLNNIHISIVIDKQMVYNNT